MLHVIEPFHRSTPVQQQGNTFTLTIHRCGEVLWGRNNVTYAELAGCTQELLRDFRGAEVRVTLNRH